MFDIAMLRMRNLVTYVSIWIFRWRTSVFLPHYLIILIILPTGQDDGCSLGAYDDSGIINNAHGLTNV